MEPMHLFSHGHRRQRHMANGLQRSATTWHNIHGAHTSHSMRAMQLTPLQFDARINARHALTSIT